MFKLVNFISSKSLNRLDPKSMSQNIVHHLKSFLALNDLTYSYINFKDGEDKFSTSLLQTYPPLSCESV